MVSQAGQYHGFPFRVLHGFTQGDSLSRTISNMVVDSVIRNWVMLVAGEEAVPDGLGRSFQWLTVLLYADFRLLVSLRLSLLQVALYILTSSFTGWASTSTTIKWWVCSAIPVKCMEYTRRRPNGGR